MVKKYGSIHSNSPTSQNYISDPKEHIQVLHYCYTYEQKVLLYVAGDTPGILSSVLIDIVTELLESYAKQLERLYELDLKSSYENKQFDGMAEELLTTNKVSKYTIRSWISLKHQNRDTCFGTNSLLQVTCLFPPCNHILSILCTYWNSIRYIRDQITQMLWEHKFHLPKRSSIFLYIRYITCISQYLISTQVQSHLCAKTAILSTE